jgi:hypothetical protein
MFAYDPSEHNPNFRQIAAEIYCGGQPSDEGFNLLKEKGIKTVINLREEPGQIARERELVESLGMTFLSVPMTPFQEPSEAAIKQFLELARKPSYLRALPAWTGSDRGYGLHISHGSARAHLRHGI